MTKTISLIALLILLLAVLFVFHRHDAPSEFTKQHDALRGTWVRDNVPDAKEDFYILHGFDDGRYVTSGSISSDDRGRYRVVSLEEDGVFEGFTVTMDVEPQEDRALIKLDHLLFRRISEIMERENPLDRQ
ncbi:MAG: hypothetical protein UY82_C0047G0002 [Candidatus Uhrbacteria bacterium GW2011_GWC2_53_7]|uniref:Uncharacterized protein n=1 Tax=Candidatus Uhrbacteria bacterium GW2011_GWC2_53_7 TaxID=1618986 RepID=A0A0G1XWA3_9BACT|nr:MAG: hypothetical protein UY82_C0047G0002 [Candidatus Uhrbacteria bacterium GW2011_GWC2_53_7]